MGYSEQTTPSKLCRETKDFSSQFCFLQAEIDQRGFEEISRPIYLWRPNKNILAIFYTTGIIGSGAFDDYALVPDEHFSGLFTLEKPDVAPEVLAPACDQIGIRAGDANIAGIERVGVCHGFSSPVSDLASKHSHLATLILSPATKTAAQAQADCEDVSDTLRAKKPLKSADTSRLDPTNHTTVQRRCKFKRR